MIRFIFAIFAILFAWNPLAFSQENSGNALGFYQQGGGGTGGGFGGFSCEVNCRGTSNPEGEIRVDLQNRCMCLPGNKCFRVAIGTGGPPMTTQGTGRLGRAQGARYQTKAFAVDSYDNDAIAMGIPENDVVGKWIHKTADCESPLTNQTAGCIGVPCERWREVKALMGSTLDVCGGGGPRSLHKKRPDPKAGPTDGIQRYSDGPDGHGYDPHAPGYDRMFEHRGGR
jgi:hypothetical protein